MITIKHLLDTPEAADGARIWVEPMGLTRDLQEWCEVEHVLPQLGPPTSLWKWFERHPDGYECFRGEYHEYLSKSPGRSLVRELASAAMRGDLTLLHQGDDPEHNTATALYEFLIELGAYFPPA